MQVVTKTRINIAYDDAHFNVVRYVMLKNENNLPVCRRNGFLKNLLMT